MEYYLNIIRKSGLKVTPRRKAIIRLFIDNNSHMTPEDVWHRLSSTFSQCGLPGVYRNLESLADCGVLARIQQFDRKKHFGLCTSNHRGDHHHIVCVNCGRVDTIDKCLLPHLEEIKGFRVVSHYMQVNGVCLDCTKKIDTS